MLNPIDLSRVDLNLLVVFTVVLDERHVGRAAGRLNLTPSAVSHALGRLRGLLKDPLFLRTPKGVVPTSRALELGGPVAEILARIGNVMALAVPFDPATSPRRFVIGGPDAVLASVMEPLLERLAAQAAGVDIGLVHLMPERSGGSDGSPWQAGLEKLEKREVDVAMLPLRVVQPRFEVRRLYNEDFVVFRGITRTSWSRCARAIRSRARPHKPPTANRSTSSFRSAAIRTASSMCC